MIALIPARGNSKGVPRKNVVDLAGKPLLAYSIEVALACKDIDGVYVSTEDKEIAEIAKKYGAEVIDRPPEFSTDTSQDREVLVHAYENLECNSWPDAVMYLRPTCPIRDPEVLTKAIAHFNKHEECTSLKSVHKISPVQKNFWQDSVYLSQFFDHLIPSMGKEYFMRNRHDFQQSFQGNSYVDILKPEVFMREGECYGDKILFFETERSVDIDTEDDLDYAEWKLNKLNKQNNES